MELDLNALQALCDAVGALKGKWVAVSVDGFAYVLVEADEFGRWDARDALATIDNLGAETLHHDVAHLLAGARTALPALIGRVRELEAAIGRAGVIVSVLRENARRCREASPYGADEKERERLWTVQSTCTAAANEVERALCGAVPVGGARDGG